MLDGFAGPTGYDGSSIDPFIERQIDTRTGVVKDVEKGRWVGTHRQGEEAPAEHVGSYSTKVYLSQRPAPPEQLEKARELGLICAPVQLYVRFANPAKALQGHNVFGPSSTKLAPMMRDFVRSLPEEDRPSNADDDRWPLLDRSRLDVNTSVDLGSHDAVHEWIHDASKCTRSRKGGAYLKSDTVTSSPTVYWQKDGRRWKMKAYCKVCEMVKHPPSVTAQELGRLIAFATGLLRIEVELHRPELEARGTVDESVVWEMMARLEVSAMSVKNLQGEEDLRGTERMTLHAWLGGGNPKGTLARNTYYRHRREIRKATGIDISLPPPSEEDRAENILWGDELRKREVKEVPESLGDLLHDPGDSPTWTRDGKATTEETD